MYGFSGSTVICMFRNNLVDDEELLIGSTTINEPFSILYLQKVFPFLQAYPNNADTCGNTGNGRRFSPKVRAEACIYWERTRAQKQFDILPGMREAFNSQVTFFGAG